MRTKIFRARVDLGLFFLCRCTCPFLFFSLIVLASHAVATEDISFINEIRSYLQRPVDVAVSRLGNFYVLDSKSSKIVKFDAGGAFIAEFGGKGSEAGQLKNPQSITVNSKDQILVADTGNHRVQAFDLQGNDLFQFGGSSASSGPLGIFSGSLGSATGKLKNPGGIATDHFDFIYVADTGNNQIHVCSPGGVFLYAIPTESSPVDIDVDLKRNIYVLAPQMSAIVQYSPQGRRLKQIVCVVNGQDYLAKATALRVDHRGDIYVSESKEHSIKKIDTKGKLLVSFGSEGGGRGQFDVPAGISVDSQDYLFIADSRNNRIQVFQVKGSKKQALSAEKSRPAFVDFDRETAPMEKGLVDVKYVPGRGIYALAGKGARIYNHTRTEKRFFGRPGKALGEMKNPASLFVEQSGRILVTDSGNDRLQILDDRGTGQFEIGQRGSKNGQFRRPSGVVVSDNGNIFVSDAENHRIQKFNNEGIFLTTFGAKSTNKDNIAEDGTFRSPSSLAMDSKGKLYVLDAGNHRVQVFDDNGNFLKAFGSKGVGRGKFEIPVDLCIDEKDHVVVADEGNNRIQVFDANGFVVAFDSQIGGQRRSSKISAVDMHDGKIYVAESDSDRVKVFSFFPAESAFPEPAKPVRPHEEREKSREEPEFELQ